MVTPISVADIEATLLMKKMLALGFASLPERKEVGPVITKFYFKPLGDSLFQKIISKGEELAGTLGVESVLIERELGLIAISVPRKDRQLIRFDLALHRMMTDKSLQEMQLPLLMGQTPSGEHLFQDLAEQPHLLIAGATGSGKSIFTAQLIASLALLKPPSELEMILVDTKQLDLVLFDGLAHVKAVLRKVDDVRSYLMILLNNVHQRTEMISGIARNVKEWNNKGYGKFLPYKVLIVDELADVFQTDEAILKSIPSKERPPSIQSLLGRVTQISRAAGIHVIVATQRPSVKIINGDIKTNFPARICFKLPTAADSRVVLDENGAECLLGKGDYFYKISGSDTIKRAHSAFISMTDIAMICSQHEQIRRQYACTC